MKRKILSTLICAALLFSLGACSKQNENSEADNAQVAEVGLNIDEMFTDRDKETAYSDYVTVTLADGGSSADGAGVTIAGDTVTITDEGTYLFTGTLSNGQIIVDTTNEAKLQIVLDGVSIQNTNSAAIYIKQADKVFLTTSNGSKNSLSVTGDYVQTDDNMVDAVIYSKDDLTMNGAGTLTIQATYGHGVVSKNDLVLTSGSYEIVAASQGLSGQDSVRIADGSYAIKSGKDGIHAENDEDESLGFLYIADGEFHITAEGDGISASSMLQIDAGDLNITAGGGSEAETMNSREARPDFNQSETQTSEEDTVSAKGIKAVGNLILNGGSIQIDSLDDALHSNTDCYVNEGSFEISTGDDGLHADKMVTVIGGSMNITKSYEGIEGQSIYFVGGVISIISSDDGVNAGGGADSSGMGHTGQDMFEADADCLLSISGGRITINASGDGVDSNGNLIVSGGEIYVSGPTNNGNGPIDYAGTASITGGIFLAAGSSGMAQNFGSESTQGSMLVVLASSQTGDIILTDDAGNVLVEYTPEKQYESVLISAPDVQEGKTYTLTAGSETQSIEMSSLIFGNGTDMGGHGGMHGGNQMPDGNVQNGGQMPAGGMQENGKRPMEELQGEKPQVE